MTEKWRRSTVLRAVLAAGLLAGILGAAPAAADAEPGVPTAVSDGPVTAGISSAEAKTLSDRLGTTRTAGVWFNREQHRLVIGVTDQAAAQEVRAAGGLAEVVTYDLAYLDSIKAKLDTGIKASGVGWGVDTPANQVSVRADETVDSAEYTQLQELIAPYGEAARLERVAGTMTAHASVNGGDYIQARSAGHSCSLGFNVRKKGDPDDKYFLTAGHCTKPTNADGRRDWLNSSNVYIGYTTGAYYPGNDFGVVRHYNADVTKYGNVHAGGGVQDITHSRDAHPYEDVCSTGYRSGYACGMVRQTNQSVRYTDGSTLHGMSIAQICRNDGDSGGPVFWGEAAVGIHSGSGGQCMAYFQPVNEALAWYGMEVY
ncbi:S1 family peptidase [Streptomyces sp. NPDC046887]|uniref:S1 family peptidase n=1 Tax=Streptomyces sp. NPDC046887 TaxID=3155472 RepID=UPI0033C1A10A